MLAKIFYHNILFFWSGFKNCIAIQGEIEWTAWTIGKFSTRNVLRNSESMLSSFSEQRSLTLLCKQHYQKFKKELIVPLIWDSLILEKCSQPVQCRYRLVLDPQDSMVFLHRLTAQCLIIVALQTLHTIDNLLPRD